MDANQPPPIAVLLEAGQEALASGSWQDARSAFEGALRPEDPAAADVSSGEAYAEFRRRPDPIQATNVALQLGFIYQANLGNDAAAAGWAAHAARLVDEFDLEPMRGWVLLIKASSCLDPGESQSLASEPAGLPSNSGTGTSNYAASARSGLSW